MHPHLLPHPKRLHSTFLLLPPSQTHNWNQYAERKTEIHHYLIHISSFFIIIIPVTNNMYQLVYTPFFYHHTKPHLFIYMCTLVCTIDLVLWGSIFFMVLYYIKMNTYALRNTWIKCNFTSAYIFLKLLAGGLAENYQSLGV